METAKLISVNKQSTISMTLFFYSTLQNLQASLFAPPLSLSNRRHSNVVSSPRLLLLSPDLFLSLKFSSVYSYIYIYINTDLIRYWTVLIRSQWKIWGELFILEVSLSVHVFHSYIFDSRWKFSNFVTVWWWLWRNLENHM